MAAQPGLAQAVFSCTNGNSGRQWLIMRE